MLPIVVDLDETPVVLLGEGEIARRRLAMLDAAGGSRVQVFAPEPSEDLAEAAQGRLVGRWPERDEIAGARLLFIADVPEEEAETFVAWAREAGTLVNTEDVRRLCDFHVPAMVRRGDLTLTISTNGRSPGLARRLRKHLEETFGCEWGGHLDEIASQRERWRAEGLPLNEIGRRTDALIDGKGWL